MVSEENVLYATRLASTIQPIEPHRPHLPNQFSTHR